MLFRSIFHDIAKGRGGDHSELGAVDAYEFCRFHKLSEHDSKLVSWLVENHLLMSSTAQRKDISDPEVVKDFAVQVRDELHLNYLYCLTVADIRATNDNLWNNWKASLLRELYFSTQKAFRRGLEKPVDVRARIRENQAEALIALTESKIPSDKIESLWDKFKPDYFLRNSAEQLAWQTRKILETKEGSVVAIKRKSFHGGTEIFVYGKDRPGLFADLVATLDSKQVTIYDARVVSSKNGYAADSFVVLERNGAEIDSSTRAYDIRHAMERVLAGEKPPAKSSKRLSRQMRQFSVKTQVDFIPSTTKHGSMLELVALDRPGLLATVAQGLDECGLTLKSAKITTIGERVEDIFLLSDGEDKALSEEKRDKVRTHMTNKLNEFNQ